MEFERAIRNDTHGVVTQPISLVKRIWDNGAVRKALVLLTLAAAWQLYALRLDNVLLFPTLSQTIDAFSESLASGELLDKAWHSIQPLLVGYLAGIVLGGTLTALAIVTRIGNDFLETVTAMLNPLPAIALLPLAMIWFGLGLGSLVFVLIHSVLWPVALNMHSGFMSVSNTFRMVGKNYGLTGPRYVFLILIPAAFPSILTGAKIGWAFAWRTLIAAELVFGVAAGSGGLGWFIYENKNMMYIPKVFAGLFAVIMIGLIVENFVFHRIQLATVDKWGMRG